MILPHVVLEEVAAALDPSQATPVVAAALLHSILVAAHGPSSCKLVKGWAVLTKRKTYARHVWVEFGGAALDPAHAILARDLGQADIASTLGIVLTVHEPDPAAYKRQDDDRQREEMEKAFETYTHKAATFWQRLPSFIQLKRRMLLRKLRAQ